MTGQTTSRPVLQVDGLEVEFTVRERTRRVRLRAVDGVNLDVGAGEAVGLVGESGCGKSTLIRAILGLAPVTGGTITLDGQDLLTMPRRDQRAALRSVQMVFQDPYSSLNPGMTVGELISEPLRVNGRWDASGPRRVDELMDLVGLRPEFRNRYPHEFSGGQRQRIGIARALVLQPKLLLLDEPVSALDVSVQAQIVNLLADLRSQLGTAMVFVSHDLSVVRHLCRRMYVMYLGRIVESGPTRELLDDGAHPYTAALVSAIPARTPAERRDRIQLQGELPSPLNPPAGCRFRPRCWRADDECLNRPHLLGTERAVACHHPLVSATSQPA